ncbi:sensor histidine kinase [Clostridium amazonitimonense]|uniref:sensor histidine kinase n=1 Tax=Clostridium amazonitimonense TaxID=1499689 RepID=UPI000509983F|nr:HAMP domain-containing sensor histidine kinase [Clostridium amazonitimonense]
MDKITKKLFKYFLMIITLVIIVSFFESTILLSKLYVNSQYKLLKENAEDVYNYLKGDDKILYNMNINGVLIKDDVILPFGKGRMGLMNKSINFTELKEKDYFITHQNQKMLSYKLKTDTGDIVVFKSSKDISDYLKIVYLILLAVFITALILALPLIIFFGKKFTNPILKLKEVSSEISKENFKVDLNLKTGDEIEELALSLKHMAKQLESKNRLQRDFIANISHDFKTPLSIIRNYSEATVDGMVDFETSKSYSKEIIKEVDRLNKLVMDIMQLSKLRGQFINLSLDYLDLNLFLMDMEVKFKNICKEKNITLKLSIDEILSNSTAEILADSDYLSRVLYNFIDNAIKFSKEGGNIDIRCSLIDNNIKIAIINEGRGIPEDIINNIWDRYYKDSESGGIGLGLAICSEILSNHGFTYGANNNSSSVTEFYFTIPSNLFRYNKSKNY